MFHDRKRMELFSSTTEVSYKLDGDCHKKAEAILDSSVHFMVQYLSVHTEKSNYYVYFMSIGRTIERPIHIHCGFSGLRSAIHCSYINFPML